MRNPPDKDPLVGLHWEQGEPPSPLSETSLRSGLESFLACMGHSGAGVSVLFANDATLRGLNRRFRELDHPTDVLSWRYPDSPGPQFLLGEIALSLERAEAQAGENGWDLQTEVLRLLAHACAHLAGHDHQDDEEERVMKALEIEMLKRVGLENIYPEAKIEG